jgi:predicted peptidase
LKAHALAIFAFALASCAGSAPPPGVERPVLAPKAAGYPYLLFRPKAAAAPKAGLPLLIFLHGSGERGPDIEKVKVHGPPKLVLSDPKFPFVVVSPLLEADGDWDVARLELMLAQVRRRIHIDPDRIYLTGLSRGGHATWRWAAAHPGLFAAIVPISGRGDPQVACSLRETPIWAFHGALDTVVPVGGSSDMAKAVNACGGSVRLTIYPDAGHDAWTRTYADPELYTWLLGLRLQKGQE